MLPVTTEQIKYRVQYRFLSILSERSSSFVDISFWCSASSDASSRSLATMSEEVSDSLWSRSRTGCCKSLFSCSECSWALNALTAACSATSRQCSSENTRFTEVFKKYATTIITFIKNTKSTDTEWWPAQ